MKTTETTAPAVTGFIPTGLKTHATMIDGVTYETTTFTATRALVMLPKIVNLLGEDGMTLFLASNDEDAKGLIEEAEVEATLMAHVMKNAVDFFDMNEARWPVLHGLQQTAIKLMKELAE